MAINNFDFPGVTLRQTFAPTVTGTVGTLSVACVGPQYRLHRATDTGAGSTEIPQSDTNRYSTGKGLTAAYLPGASQTGVLDTNSASQHLVVKDGIFSYHTLEGTVPATGTDLKYTIDFGTPIADGDYFIAGASFGDRGVKAGDPVIIEIASEAETLLVETKVASIQNVEGKGKVRLVIEDGLFKAEDGSAAAGESFNVTFAIKQDAVFAQSADTFELTQTSVSVKGGLTTTLLENGLTGTLQSGKFYVEYREFVSEYVGSIGSVASASDVEDILGPITNENPLAQAVYAAASASNNVIVYFTGVRSDDAAGYTEALSYLENFDMVYSIVPVSTDPEVITACAALVVAVSENEDSKVRRSLWYSADTPEVLTLVSSNTLQFTVSAGEAAGTQELEFSKAAFSGIVAKDGDMLSINDKSYPVKTVRPASIVVTGTDIVSTVAGTATKVVYLRTKPINEDLVDAIIAKRVVSSYKAQCVWSDGAYMFGERVGNFVLAAAAAGMRSYEECQRPLSNLGYTFFTCAEEHGFTKAQLLLLGSEGIWIVGNNTTGTPINRKQVTTAIANNINMDEESIVANADEIALSLCHLGEDMVGNSNISGSVLGILNTMIYAVMERKTANSTNDYVGPQLLSWELLELYQDPVNRDEVYADMECEPPKPFNKFRMSMRIV